MNEAKELLHPKIGIQKLQLITSYQKTWTMPNEEEDQLAYFVAIYYC